MLKQGFSQVKGIDYFRKFSHSISLDSLRLFLAKCNNAGLEIYEADYVTAYLNAMLGVKVFMLQAPGFPAVDKDGMSLLARKDNSLCASSTNQFMAWSRVD